MNWNHRLAAWIVDLLCPHLGKAKPQYKVDEDLLWNRKRKAQPDELREEDDHRMDAMLYWKPQITEHNRKRLEALWTKK